MSPHRIRTAIIGLAFGLLVASCGGSEDGAGVGAAVLDATPTTAAADTTAATVPPSTPPALPPTDYAGFTTQTTACGADAPAPVTPMTFAAPEDQQLDPDTPVAATISTSCGDIVVELDPATAPETVNSFVFLARSGYFDGTVSHRVLPGFVIQAGDQSATGTQGPGYTIPDELPETGFVYEAGVLAMANAGPNTTGSQFFIVLADVALPNSYSYFGKVVDGFDTLDRVAAVPLGANLLGEVSVPLETVYIEAVTVSD